MAVTDTIMVAAFVKVTDYVGDCHGDGDCH
jgi:hypothetical protein